MPYDLINRIKRERGESDRPDGRWIEDHPAEYHQGMWKVPIGAIVGFFIGAGVAAALEASGAPEFVNLLGLASCVGGGWIGWKLHLQYPPPPRDFLQFGTRGMLMLVTAIALPAALWRIPECREVLLFYWVLLCLAGSWAASAAVFARLIKRTH
ncbi:MAG TPA: hypothetical protein VGG64_06510 [Pirellulales bacterium]